MSRYKMYRRVSDGMLFETCRYGNEAGAWRVWDKESITKVVAFLIGFDPENTTITNERILDIVRPVVKGFDPFNGVADIEVVDPTNGSIHVLKLGDWILKSPNASFIFCDTEEFEANFEVVSQESELEQLTGLIFMHVRRTEGKSPHSIAEKLATEILKAGWTRPS